MGCYPINSLCGRLLALCKGIFFMKTSCNKVRHIVIEKYNYKCAYCGVDITLKTMHIDHIKPLLRSESGSRKGDNTIENYNPACAPCNISKSSFDLEVWRNEIQLKLNRIERDSSTYRNLRRFGLVGVLKTDVKFYFETLK